MALTHSHGPAVCRYALLAIPSLFDLASASLLIISLMNIDASIWMLLCAPPPGLARLQYTSSLSLALALALALALGPSLGPSLACARS